MREEDGDVEKIPSDTKHHPCILKGKQVQPLPIRQAFQHDPDYLLPTAIWVLIQRVSIKMNQQARIS